MYRVESYYTIYFKLEGKLMSAMPHSDYPMNEADYLAFDRESDVRHEFVNGEVVAMAGASWNHTLIVSNINTRLNVNLEGTSCNSVTSDLRVHVKSVKSYRFPDVVVVCGTPEFTDDDNDILLNPILLVEVLSPSTATIDRNEKMKEYFQIPSLQEYMIVYQEDVRVERYLRDKTYKDWRLAFLTDIEDTLTLPSLDCELSLTDIYNQVRFKSSKE